MDKIPETAYLSADKAELYRTITRLLYNEKELFNAQLGTDEILDKVKQCSGFSCLTLDELKPALTQLTDWGNLVPMQDPRRVSTIEEYKNKQYRYSLTECSIKIERMTIELENLFSGGNVLSTSSLKNIDNYLYSTDRMAENDDLNEVNEWWESLQEEFKRLNQNYSDYLHTFYSVKGEKMIRSVEFILHKDKFVEYLRNFIRVLQRYSGLIEKTLLNVKDDVRNKLISKIVESELALPRTDTEALDTRNMSDKIKGQWNALYNWFVTTDSAPSVCSMAMEYTNEIIRKILSNAVMLMQLQNAGISRKQDYRAYMSMFAACDNIDDAHCLSAHVFGVMNAAHYKYNTDRDTDSIFVNASDLQPQIFEVKPQTRVYKPKIRSAGFSANELLKAERRMTQIAKIQREQKMIEEYISDNIINLAELENKVVPTELRVSLLKWISAANQNKSRTGITDFGRKFHIVNTGSNTVLHCEDGELHMPAYIIEFEEITNE
jgi:uncharacterized protein (TIGR02677 family)